MLHPLLQELHHLDYAADAAGVLAVVDEELRGVAAGEGWPDDRSPFPGLRAFDTDWQRVFFGHERDITALVTLLRSPAEQATGEIVTVVGPSGCGKSSLVRAGLLPAMAREPGWWVLAPVVPGEDPVGALARELAAEAVKLGRRWTIEEVRARLAGASGLAELADEMLVAASGRQRRTRLLLVVDQFEETLTRASAQRRGQFVRLLAQAAAGPVAVVTTLRPEFLDPLLSDPELAELKVRPVAVRPLDTAALTAAVVGPARVAGIGVDETLAARMVTDTGTGEALPLLAFALERLAAEVARGGRLSPKRYDQIGGVTGALSAQADAAMAEARNRSGRGAEEVLTGLLRLVTVDETGRPTRRRMAYSQLPDPVRAELAAFIDRRLLTTDEVDGVVSIGVAYEAFLGAWPPLADAVAKAAVALRTRREVEHAAADWAATGRPQRRLWIRGQLSAAVENLGARLRRTDHRRGRGWFTQRTLHAARIDLGDTGHQFLHASIRHDRWLRRRSITILSGLLVVAIVAAGIAVVNLRRANEQQRNAQALQRTVQDQQRLATARQLMARGEERMDGDLRTALRFKLAAHRIRPDAETQMGVFNTLARTPYAGTMPDRAGSLSSMTLSPDGRTLITSNDDGPVVLWDLSDRAYPQRLSQLPTDQTGRLWPMTLSSDGRTLVTFSVDGMVVLWGLSDPAHPQRLGQFPTDQTGAVLWGELSPDGRTLVTSSEDGMVVLWDLSDPAHPQRLGQFPTNQTGPVGWGELTPDGRTLITSSEDGMVILWDLSDRTHPQQLGQLLRGHTGWVNSVALSSDGRTLVTGSNDHMVILFDLSDRTHPQQLGQPLTVHTNSVNSVALSSDGHTLVTGSTDRTVIVWDLSDRAHPHQLSQLLTGHTSPVRSVALTPDGRTLVTGSADNTVILFDLSERTHPRQLGQPLTGSYKGLVTSVALTPDGRTLVIGSADNTVILWDLSDRAHPRQLGQPMTGHTGPVRSMAMTPDGHTLATGSDDGTAILWDTGVILDLRDRAIELACAYVGGGFGPDDWARYVPGLPYQDSCAT